MNSKRVFETCVGFLFWNRGTNEIRLVKDNTLYLTLPVIPDWLLIVNNLANGVIVVTAETLYSINLLKEIRSMPCSFPRLKGAIIIRNPTRLYGWTSSEVFVYPSLKPDRVFATARRIIKVQELVSDYKRLGDGSFVRSYGETRKGHPEVISVSQTNYRYQLIDDTKSITLPLGHLETDLVLVSHRRCVRIPVSVTIAPGIRSIILIGSLVTWFDPDTIRLEDLKLTEYLPIARFLVLLEIIRDLPLELIDLIIRALIPYQGTFHKIN